MANIDPRNTLALLNTALIEQREATGTTPQATALQRAQREGAALTQTLSGLQEVQRFNAQRELLMLRQQLEQDRAQAEAESQRNALITQFQAQADANFLSGRSEDDRQALRGTMFEEFYRDQELRAIRDELALGDATDPAVQQQFAAANQAVQLNDQQRLARGITPELYQQAIQQGNYNEIYANRNNSDFNPIAFARNVAGSAVSGLAGLADLGLSAVGAGGVGEAISDAGQSLGGAIDSQTLGSGIFQERLANGPEDQSFTEGVASALSALSPGAAASLVADLGGMLAGGGVVTAPIRAGARALGAGQTANRAGALLQRGGTPALAVGAGEDFAAAGIEGDNSGRQAQAITQLLGTLGLGAAGGTALGGQLFGGIEGAVGRGVGNLRGSLPALQRSGVGGVAENVATRLGAGATGAVRQGVSEGAQEFLEGGLSQGAASVGTGTSQFNAGELGQGAALGFALGGGLGAGRVGATRARPEVGGNVVDPSAFVGPVAPSVSTPTQPSVAGPGAFVGPVQPAAVAAQPQSDTFQPFVTDTGLPVGDNGQILPFGQRTDTPAQPQIEQQLELFDNQSGFAPVEGPQRGGLPATTPQQDFGPAPVQTSIFDTQPQPQRGTAAPASQPPIQLGADGQPAQFPLFDNQQAPIPPIEQGPPRPVADEILPDDAFFDADQLDATQTDLFPSASDPVQAIPDDTASLQESVSQENRQSEVLRDLTPSEQSVESQPAEPVRPAAPVEVRAESAPRNEVFTQESREDLENIPGAPAIKLDNLYTSLENRDLPTAIRQAEQLVRDGEYSIEDMRDAALASSDPRIEQAFTQRLDKLAAKLSNERSQGQRPTRGTPAQMRARVSEIETLIDQAQAAENYDVVPALRTEMLDLQEALRSNPSPELPQQESVRQVSTALSNDDIGDPLVGEPQPAGLRRFSDPDVTVLAARRASVPLDRTQPAPATNRRAVTRPTALSRGVNTVDTESSTDGQDLPVTRMPAQDIRARVSTASQGLPFEVVDSGEALTPEFREQVRRDTGYDFDDGVKAVYYDGALYINASNITDQADLDMVLAHEILGHAGLRAKYGPDLSAVLKDMITSYGSVDELLLTMDRLGYGRIRRDYAELIARIPQEGKYGPSAQVVAEEAIVALVESGGLDSQRANIIERGGALIKRWLRSKFPKLADYFDFGYADWELMVLATEAAHAGRSLHDAAYPASTVRAFASRRVPATERARSFYDKSGAAARKTYSDIFLAKDPIDQRASNLSRSVRQAGSRAVESGRLGTEENFYTKTIRKFVNNRRPLQSTSAFIRRTLSGDRQLVQRASAAIVNATASRNVQIHGDNKAALADHLQNHFNNRFDPNTDAESRAETLIDRAALYETRILSEQQAEQRFQTGTAAIREQLDTGYVLLSNAMEGRATKRDAHDLHASVRRDRHAIERNDAFWHDFTKNKRLRKYIGKEGVDELKAIRKLTRSRGADAITPAEAARLEREAIYRRLDETTIDDFNNERDNEYVTAGKDSSTAAARQRLIDLELTQGELEAMGVIDDALNSLADHTTDVLVEGGKTSRNYHDAIERFNFQFYSPQLLKDPAHDDTFDIGNGVFDLMHSTTEAARGTNQETVDPAAALLTQASRAYHDKADNEVKMNLLDLWAAAQDNDVGSVIGAEFGEATLTMVPKTSGQYEKLLSKVSPNQFIIHPTDIDPAVANASTRGEYNAALRDSASNYVFLLTYQKPKGGKPGSPIPKLVKGNRENSKLVKQLQQSDSMIAGVLTNGARTMGSFHTKYDPAWPVIQLLRDTVAAFLTVGAQEGFDGAKAFTNEGLGSVMALAPRMSSYLYHREKTDQKSIDKVKALSADPELSDFLDFINSGAPSPFSRSMSIQSQVEELSGSLTNRVLTPGEGQVLDDVDNAIGLLSNMTDVVGRYAAYKAFRSRGYSKQEAAAASRNIADFGQRGESSYADIGSMLYMFFRSSAIGATQIIDTLLASKYNLETLGLSVGISSALFALAVTMSPEDEEGNNLFLTQGNSTTHFKLFIDEDTILQIPYAYNGFSAAGAAAIQSLYGLTGNQSFLQSATNIADIVTNNVSPASNNIAVTDREGNLDLAQVGKKFFDLAAPDLASPLLGLSMNVNNFGAPIQSEPGSLGDPGTVGAAFDSTGSQVGSSAEVLTRALFDATGIPVSVRQTNYLLNEMFNGPTAIFDSALEWYRIATGRDYKPNWKRAAVPFAGVIGSPYDTSVERYYELKNGVDSIQKSERLLIRSGMSEDEAVEAVRSTIGEERYDLLQSFEPRARELDSFATELRDLRLNSVDTSAERLTKYRDAKREYDARVGALIRDIEGR